MSLPSSYKPSPLSIGSPRTSPFRRAQSPASASTVRAAAVTSSPTKVHTPRWSAVEAEGPPGKVDCRSGRGPCHVDAAETVPSPSRLRPVPPSSGRSKGVPIRELREAFQMLDRDGDGLVGREDVATMLNHLGQDSSPSTMSAFFPAGAPPTLALAQFLGPLSTLLGEMSSRADELWSALAAFDEDDHGQIEVTELREALLRPPPPSEPGDGEGLSAEEMDQVIDGFRGRKTSGKKFGKEEVFRYQDFLAAVTGVGAPDGPPPN